MIIPMKKALVIVFGLLATTAQAQNNLPQIAGIGPFSLVVERSQTIIGRNGGHALEITLQNVGTKAAVAYILRVEFVDSTGKVTSASASRIIKLIDPANPSNATKLFVPGETWKHPKPLFIAVDKNGNEHRYQATVDYISFADGSSWGPDVSQLSKDLNAYLQGLNAARRFYAEKLNREGPEALKKELPAVATQK